MRIADDHGDVRRSRRTSAARSTPPAGWPRRGGWLRPCRVIRDATPAGRDLDVGDGADGSHGAAVDGRQARRIEADRARRGATRGGRHENDTCGAVRTGSDRRVAPTRPAALAVPAPAMLEQRTEATRRPGLPDGPMGAADPDDHGAGRGRGRLPVLADGGLGAARRWSTSRSLPATRCGRIAGQAAPDRDPREVIEEIRQLNDMPGACCRWAWCCGCRRTVGGEPADRRRRPGPRTPAQIDRPRHAVGACAPDRRGSTVNPYIWYLHGCKISTGCATIDRQLSTAAASCAPVVHTRSTSAANRMQVDGHHDSAIHKVHRSSTERPQQASTAQEGGAIMRCPFCRHPGLPGHRLARGRRRPGHPPPPVLPGVLAPVHHGRGGAARGGQAQRGHRAVQPEQGHRRRAPGLPGPPGRRGRPRAAGPAGRGGGPGDPVRRRCRARRSGWRSSARCASWTRSPTCASPASTGRSPPPTTSPRRSRDALAATGAGMPPSGRSTAGAGRHRIAARLTDRPSSPATRPTTDPSARARAPSPTDQVRSRTPAARHALHARAPSASSTHGQCRTHATRGRNTHDGDHRSARIAASTRRTVVGTKGRRARSTRRPTAPGGSGAAAGAGVHHAGRAPLRRGDLGAPRRRDDELARRLGQLRAARRRVPRLLVGQRDQHRHQQVLPRRGRHAGARVEPAAAHRPGGQHATRRPAWSTATSPPTTTPRSSRTS